MKFAMLAGLIEVLTKRVLKIEQRPIIDPAAVAEDVLSRLPAPKDGVSPDPQAITEAVLARIPAPPTPAEIAAHVVVPKLVLPTAASIAALIKVPAAPAAPTAKAVAALVPRAKDGEAGPPGPPGPPGPKPAHRWDGTKLQFEKPDGTWGPKVELKGKDGQDGKSRGGGGGYVSAPPSSGGVQIDDDVESLEKTWSSSKIREEIDAAPGGGGGGITSVNGDTGPAVVLDKTDIGLPLVENIAPLDMPVSDATNLVLLDLQSQLDELPANIATQDDVESAVLEAKGYTDLQVNALVASAPGALDTLKELADALGDDPNFATTVTNAVAAKENTIAAGTTAQYWRGDKTWQPTSGLPVSTAQQTALDAKEPTITSGTASQYLKGNKTLGTFLTDVMGSVLTGFSTATNAAVVAADSLLAAVGKLQAQINAILAMLPTTGDFKFVVRAAAPSGWMAVTAANMTIGNASSGATRANADTEALFTAWWTDYSNTVLPILTSAGAGSTRGANAAADYAANKRLSVPDIYNRHVRAAGSLIANGAVQDATRIFYDTLSDGVVRVAHAGSQPLNPEQVFATDTINIAYATGTNAGPAANQATASVRVSSVGMLACIKL